MKKALVLGMSVISTGFGLNWGIWGGPGAGLALTRMDVVHDEILQADDIFPDYDIGLFDNYQIGLVIPVTFRLENFVVSAGNVYSWPNFKGDDWQTWFEHNINITSMGYLFEIGKHFMVAPLFGIGNYSITMCISEKDDGGFGDPEDVDLISRTYDYYSFSFAAGAELDYVWKFENNVVIGVGAKAHYLLPLTPDDEWDARGGYKNASIPDFHSHTPVLGVNFVIGYERIKQEDDSWKEEGL
ncbi:hypothetical protein JXM67_00065 [candidate division WOR-3 bacterium]|nr:hypothetical protein [candidate division WOR-3 bacterium]